MVFESLRDRIVLGEYEPGKMLSEQDICSELKVSRTPFREAVKRLEEIKLVKVVPRYGTYVAEIDIQEAKYAYEVRSHLEVLAAGLAAERRTAVHIEQINGLIMEVRSLLDKPDNPLKVDLDRRLHMILRDAANNPILSDTLDRLYLISSRIWISQMRENYSNERILESLMSILQALKEKDSDKLSRIMSLHMKETFDLLKQRSP
jgi:DNA-binding GntR family transcriptional regulator